MTSGQTSTINPDDMTKLLKEDNNLRSVAMFVVVNMTYVESIRYRNYDFAVIMSDGRIVTGDPEYIRKLKQPA
jgi:Fe-S cluster assembly ATPase SufC